MEEMQMQVGVLGKAWYFAERDVRTRMTVGKVRLHWEGILFYIEKDRLGEGRIVRYGQLLFTLDTPKYGEAICFLVSRRSHLATKQKQNIIIHA